MCRNNRGFTLIESVIAVAILAIGILSLFTLTTRVIGGNAVANRITSEVIHGSDLLENILGRNYFDLDGNGTGTDSASEDEDGDVDNDGMAGLDSSGCCQNGQDPAGNVVAGCTAPAMRSDFCAVSPDNRYFIYWNIVVGQPDTGMKTVRVFIRDSVGNNPDTILTSIKVDI